MQIDRSYPKSLHVRGENVLALASEGGPESDNRDDLNGAPYMSFCIINIAGVLSSYFLYSE